MGVEVSICAVTFRRPRGLARLLESLGRLKLPEGVAAEIVLVDNDPEGAAFHAPDRQESAGGLAVHWHHEPRGDIAHARNRCVDAARGRWIAFIDDDEAAHEGWIAAFHWLSEQVEARSRSHSPRKRAMGGSKNQSRGRSSLSLTSSSPTGLRAMHCA